MSERDTVNPPYYRSFGIEPLDFIEANEFGYHQGSVIKYAARAGRKPGEPVLKDLIKCRTFLERWIKLEEARQGLPLREVCPGGYVVDRDQPAVQTSG